MALLVTPAPGLSSAAANRIVAIVQARMGSTRLGGKVLVEIAGRPMLWHVVSRARRAARIDAVMVATSIDPADDAIEEFCRERGIALFRGSEADVLDRFHGAAAAAGAAAIVRLTADCPLLDAGLIDLVVDRFQAGDCDYASNAFGYTYPDGLDTEVFSAEALERAWREATLPAEREHVTVYMRASGKFRVASVDNPAPQGSGSLRWTVDEPRDLAFVRAVYDRLGRDGSYFGMEDVLRLLRQEPELKELNGEIVRQEGYYRTLLAESPLPPQQPTGRRIEFSSRADAPVLVPDAEMLAAAARRTRGRVPADRLHAQSGGIARLLLEVVRSADAAHIVSSGSDAVGLAAAVARRATGRRTVAVSISEEPLDWFDTPPGDGPPIVRFAYNDAEGLERLLAEHAVAAVLLEPIAFVEPRGRFLQRVRHATAERRILLVFDERRTMFRLASGGAQEYFDVHADLTCLGESIAGGRSLGALLGDRRLLEDATAHRAAPALDASTLGLAEVVLERLVGGDLVPFLWAQGQKLKDSISVFARRFDLNVACTGLPPLTRLSSTAESEVNQGTLSERFSTACAQYGLLTRGVHQLSSAHGEGEIERTLRVYRTAFEELAREATPAAASGA